MRTGLLSGEAVELIKDLPLEQLIVTNTISQRENAKHVGSKLETMDVSPVLAESIRRTHNGESISMLFQAPPFTSLSSSTGSLRKSHIDLQNLRL
jgi:phosphoribosylpyrophosphate synthetase